jgi:hypothetical protein
MEKSDLKGWPDFWPPPEVFLGSLVAHIAWLHYISVMMEHQVIIRFKNRYGVKISQHFLHDGVYSIAFLRFFGPKLDNYRLVKDSPIPEIDLPPVVVPSFKLELGLSQARDPGGA